MDLQLIGKLSNMGVWEYVSGSDCLVLSEKCKQILSLETEVNQLTSSQFISTGVERNCEEIFKFIVEKLN